MRNIRLLLEYDGSQYAGWQFQAGQRSIEEELLKAISRLTGCDVALQVAGRTDAGVHAVGQVVSFLLDSTVPTHKFAPGLNNFLPNDISVHSAEEALPSFDARRDSVAKRYRYRVYCGPQPAALETHALQIRKTLDIEAMRSAAAHLVGAHDFNAFRSAHCDADHARRRVFSVDITEVPRPPVGTHVDILFHANAYCRHMCRIMAGTLVEVGMAKRPVKSVAQALESGDRSMAGMTAAPTGLTLLEVVYPP